MAAYKLVKKNNPKTDKTEKPSPIDSAALGEKPPEGMGRNFVLSICLSKPLSCHIFRIAAPEAPIETKINDIDLIKKLSSEGAIIIAHKAVKITREMTPGFINT